MVLALRAAVTTAPGACCQAGRGFEPPGFRAVVLTTHPAHPYVNSRCLVPAACVQGEDEGEDADEDEDAGVLFDSLLAWRGAGEGYDSHCPGASQLAQSGTAALKPVKLLGFVLAPLCDRYKQLGIASYHPQL